MNGIAATTANATITLDTAAVPAYSGAPVPTLSTSTGIISIPTGTPAGVYTIKYKICGSVATTTCDTDTATITVATPAIDAVTETLVSTSNGGITTSVLANDTYNGGVAGSATTSNVNLTAVGTYPTGITLNADGTITVAAGTPPASYALEYKICDKINPSNCDNVATIVIVTPTVNAITDNFSATGNDALEGITNLGNVLANDNINAGAPGSATIDNVTITVTNAATPILSGGLVPVLDAATGIIIVPVGTPAGSYSITYKICDKATDVLCSSIQVNVEISAATFCYTLPVVDPSTESELTTRVGISALARAGVTSTWPGIRKSGWIVLEAKTKGFVINRVQFNASNQPVASNGTTPVITNPVEGMMVFDITNNCLKVFTTIDGNSFAWYCMETQTCPE